MKLAYVNDPLKPRAVPLLSVKTGQAFAVLLSPHASEWRRLLLHWDKSAQRRIPCFAERCRCRDEYWPAELRVYVPAIVAAVRLEGALWLRQKGVGMARGIVGVTQAMVGILDERHRDWWNVIYRKGRKENSPMGFTPLENCDKAPGLEFPSGLDVEGTLEAVFGARTRVDGEKGRVESPYKGPHGV